MKYKLLIIASFVFSFAKAQTIKNVKTKPDKITVYLYGAEISSSESLTLVAGTNEIVIEGVSPSLDENSISAYFKGAMVVDVRKNLKYPEVIQTVKKDEKYTKIIERLVDSLDDVGFLIRDCDNKKVTLEKEKYLLLNNRLMRGEFAKDSLNLLKSSLDLLRARLNNIDEEALNLDRKLSKHYKLQAKLTERKEHYEYLLNNPESTDLTPLPYTPVTQIIVTIEAESAVSGSLKLKYYVANAGWQPRYDIIAGSGKDKIQILQRAQVSQSTGIDWKDVTLMLSTSNPRQGNSRPMMSLWNLVFGYPETYMEKKRRDVTAYNYNMNAAPRMTQKEDLANSKALNTDDASWDFKAQEPIFSTGEGLLQTEYTIKTKTTIASDSKIHNVLVSNDEVAVNLTYYCAPKLDKDAFLMAKVANWEDLNLLPASARIYFDDSYVGNTVVDPGTVKDTLYLDLGRDRSINVKRLALKDKCKDQVLGDDRVVTKTIEITIRNTKDIVLDFELEDQIPVSSDPNIKVTLLGSDNAVYNELSGKLTWKMKIKSKDVRKVRFSFEVKYPKTKILNGL